MYSVGNIANNYGYHDDHLEIYGNIKLLYCAPEANSVLWVNFISKQMKQTNWQKEIRFVLTRGKWLW